MLPPDPHERGSVDPKSAPARSATHAPGTRPNSPAFTLDTEKETPPPRRGWSFHLRITRGDEIPSDHEFTLSWADYEYWSHGSQPPSRIAESVLKALLAERPEVFAKLPPRFDASTVRRWVRELDERLNA